jgi:prophage tail gpP-like protein
MILKINDRIKIRTIDFFDDFKLELKHDSIASTFSFGFYFDPTNKEHAELACVSHYHEVIVEHNDERLITGYIISNTFNSGAKKDLAQIAGYSKTGVLEDSDITPKYFPLETNGLTLQQIAEKYIQPFGISLVIDKNAKQESTIKFVSNGNADDDAIDSVVVQQSLADKVSSPIDKATAKTSQNIKNYLTELASQRNVLISHDAFGNLLFTEPKTNQKPILHFEQGTIGVAMSLSFSGQQLHSEIWAVKQADSDGGNAAEDVIRNPFVPIVYRPKVVVMTSGTDITVPEFLQKELSKELKNISLTITTNTWEVDGKIIKPNSLITVTNPDLFLYKKTTWFIESVVFKGDSKSTTAVLNCVLPEVYNNKTPKNIFVDSHQNFPRQ